MSNIKDTENEYITFSSLLEEKGLNEKTIKNECSLSEINQSFSNSIPTSSMYYISSDEENSNEITTNNHNQKNNNNNNNNKLHSSPSSPVEIIKMKNIKELNNEKRQSTNSTCTNFTNNCYCNCSCNCNGNFNCNCNFNNYNIYDNNSNNNGNGNTNGNIKKNDTKNMKNLSFISLSTCTTQTTQTNQTNEILQNIYNDNSSSKNKIINKNKKNNKKGSSNDNNNNNKNNYQNNNNNIDRHQHQLENNTENENNDNNDDDFDSSSIIVEISTFDKDNKYHDNNEGILSIPSALPITTTAAAAEATNATSANATTTATINSPITTPTPSTNTAAAAIAAFTMNNRISLSASEDFTFVNSSPDMINDDIATDDEEDNDNDDNDDDDNDNDNINERIIPSTSITTQPTTTSIFDTNKILNEKNIKHHPSSNSKKTSSSSSSSTSSKASIKIINNKQKEKEVEVDLTELNYNNNETKITNINEIKVEKEKEEEEEEEDNLCAICLIETKQPTDIEDIKNKKNKKKNKNKNNDNNNNSNDTVINIEDDEDEEEEEEEINIDDFECKLHCKHKFHYSCIAQWLERNQVCPICRMEIKKYEIEAIEKRFSISIDVKEESLHLHAPRYNLTYDFDINVTPELIQNYFNEKLPHLNMKAYVIIRFLLYLLLFTGITAFGLAIVIANLINGDTVYFTTYSIVVISLVYYIILLVRIYCAKRKQILFSSIILKYPTGSLEYYQMVIINSLILFAGISNNIEGNWNLESTFQNVVIFFYVFTILWCIVEGKLCINILKEESRRRAEIEADRLNEEIRTRAREEQEREREEFERTFSNLN